ncbi:MAG: DUF945 family protein [Desulfocapsaceae bacterium]|nr:DUF945 family protein [Desulfocapsaceae bacterium]
MKKIIAVIILIIVLGGAAPYVNGLLMERTVRQAFDNANAIYTESNTDYSLEVVRYDRGFRTSEIEWKIDLGSLKAVYGVDEIVFVDRAKHGYTGVVSTTSLSENLWFQDFIDNRLQGDNPFNITTTYSFLGEIVSSFTNEPFSLTIDGDILEVKESNFEIIADNSLQKFTSTGSWQGMQAGDKVDFGAMTMSAEMEMLSTFLWDGNFQFTIDRLKIDEKQAYFNFADLNTSYTSKVDQVKNTISTESTVTMASLDTNNLVVNGAKATFGMNNMDAQAYENFMDFYTRTVSGALAEAAALEDDPQGAGKRMEEQMSRVGLQAVSALEQLLQAGLEFQVTDAEISLQEGDIQGDLTLRLLRDMTLMQFAPVVGQPDLALDILYLSSNVKLPAAFADKAPQLLMPLYQGMQTGLFVKDGDILSHQAETRNEKLYLNGNEVILKR